VGVTALQYSTSGAFVTSGAVPVNPAASAANTTFTLTIPFNVTLSDLVLTAFASDAAGNQGHSAPVHVILTGADITPPATMATAASAPGAGTTTTITYQVTDGLADLDHVELYFRRNAMGTFNLYAGFDGAGTGHYFPQSGATGDHCLRLDAHGRRRPLRILHDRRR